MGFQHFSKKRKLKCAKKNSKQIGVNYPFKWLPVWLAQTENMKCAMIDAETEMEMHILPSQSIKKKKKSVFIREVLGEALLPLDSEYNISVLFPLVQTYTAHDFTCLQVLFFDTD